jgi:hypothetical protein
MYTCAASVYNGAAFRSGAYCGVNDFLGKSPAHDNNDQFKINIIITIHLAPPFNFAAYSAD